jgi:acetyltransferase-like isoleucine patch superfamily enzyme
MSSLVQAWRAWRLSKAGVAIDRDCRLGAHLTVRSGSRGAQPGRVAVAAHCELEDGVILDAYGGSIEIASGTFVGPHSLIYGHGGVTIGDRCLIASHCCILSSNHTLAPFGTDIRTQPDVLLPTRLGRDIWLGAHVTILGGVTIGDGCVIGAGAVVTKDLPAGAIAHGVPAVIQRYRDNAPNSAR